MTAKGIRVIGRLQHRDQDKRGGQAPHEDGWDRSQFDGLATCQDAYVESLAVRNYSPATLTIQRKSIKLFILWAHERDLTLAGQITRPILENYQRSVFRYTKDDGKHLGWNTQLYRINHLKRWFSWLTRQNILLHNPASELELPRPQKTLREVALSREEVLRLLQAPNISDPLGVRDRAMLELFYSTGLRRFELCGLELSDYHPDRRTLHIRLGKGKKDRFVPVGEHAIYWLDQYLTHARPQLCLDSRTSALFLTGYSGPFNPDVLSRLVSKLVKQAGLGAKGSCHLLRHTCATHMLEGGADIRYIQQLLGHSNLDTTAIYTQVSILQLQEVHRRCHPASKRDQKA
jgi:integrase/recombinase XerD